MSPRKNRQDLETVLLVGVAALRPSWRGESHQEEAEAVEWQPDRHEAEEEGSRHEGPSDQQRQTNGQDEDGDSAILGRLNLSGGPIGFADYITSSGMVEICISFCRIWVFICVKLALSKSKLKTRQIMVKGQTAKERCRKIIFLHQGQTKTIRPPKIVTRNAAEYWMELHRHLVVGHHEVPVQEEASREIFKIENESRSQKKTG